MRYALYYAPAEHDPLWEAGAAWLGRDPVSNNARLQPDIAGLAHAVSRAATYGFHATLKAPMRVADAATLCRDARALAARHEPFALPGLSVSDESGFLALTLNAPCPALQRLADDCVQGLDHHRLPPTDAELARRRAAPLSAAQDRNLRRWGYHDVLDTWCFHMTLSRRLPATEIAPIRAAAQAHFAPSLQTPRQIESLCVFHQPGPDQPFILLDRYRLGPG